MTDTIAILQNLKSSIDMAIDEASKPELGEVEAALSMGRIDEIATRIKELVTAPTTTNADLMWLPYKLLAVQIGLEIRLFENVTSHTSLTSLAETTKAEPQLLLRIIRVLISQGYLIHEQDGTYSSTPLSQNLLTPAIRSWVSMGAWDMWDFHKAWLPFLERGEWQNPDDPKYTVPHYATGKSFWDYLNSDPKRRRRYDSAMAFQEHIPKWMRPDFDFTSQISMIRMHPDTVILVDIGGGKGQVLESIRSDHPRLTGRMILQDLPETISQVDHERLAALNIEALAYDFFTTQPIKGARYYHLRRVLHDWPDSACVEILAQIHEAMLSTADYSRLLIHESVLPDRDVGVREALQDMAMMQIVSGMERSKSQWTELLAKVGLKITRIHQARLGLTSILEAEVDIT